MLVSTQDHSPGLEHHPRIWTVGTGSPPVAHGTGDRVATAVIVLAEEEGNGGLIS